VDSGLNAGVVTVDRVVDVATVAPEEVQAALNVVVEAAVASRNAVAGAGSAQMLSREHQRGSRVPLYLKKIFLTPTRRLSSSMKTRWLLSNANVNMCASTCLLSSPTNNLSASASTPNSTRPKSTSNCGLMNATQNSRVAKILNGVFPRQEWKRKPTKRPKLRLKLKKDAPRQTKFTKRRRSNSALKDKPRGVKRWPRRGGKNRWRVKRGSLMKRRREEFKPRKKKGARKKKRKLKQFWRRLKLKKWLKLRPLSRMNTKRS